jgi:hypothetical protein
MRPAIAEARFADQCRVQASRDFRQRFFATLSGYVNRYEFLDAVASAFLTASRTVSTLAPSSFAIAAILSIVETCRRMKIPIRDYLAAVLPGIADVSIQRLADLTPAAWAAQRQ